MSWRKERGDKGPRCFVWLSESAHHEGNGEAVPDAASYAARNDPHCEPRDGVHLSYDLMATFWRLRQ